MALSPVLRPFPTLGYAIQRGVRTGFLAALGFALIAMVPFLLYFAPPSTISDWQEGLFVYAFAAVAALIIAAIVGFMGGAAMALLIWLFFRFVPKAISRHAFVCGFLLCLLPALIIATYESLYQIAYARGAGGGPILFSTEMFALLLLPTLVAAFTSGWFTRRYFASEAFTGHESVPVTR